MTCLDPAIDYNKDNSTRDAQSRMTRVIKFNSIGRSFNLVYDRNRNPGERVYIANGYVRDSCACNGGNMQEFSSNLNPCETAALISSRFAYRSK